MDRLAPDEVHLWRVAITESDAPHATSVLTEADRRRAARYRFVRDQREFMVTRGVLRHLLAHYSGQPAETLTFRHNSSGKPSLPGGPQFNVSHSRGFALIAVSHLCVGVDLEHLDTEFAWEPVARHFFTPAERDWISSQPADVRAEHFFQCWTRREAYVKARGQGVPTEAVCCIPATIRDGDLVWSIESCKPFTGYIAAVAAQSESFHYTVRDFVPSPATPKALASRG